MALAASICFVALFATGQLVVAKASIAPHWAPFEVAEVPVGSNNVKVELAVLRFRLHLIK